MAQRERVDDQTLAASLAIVDGAREHGHSNGSQRACGEQRGGEESRARRDVVDITRAPLGFMQRTQFLDAQAAPYPADACDGCHHHHAEHESELHSRHTVHTNWRCNGRPDIERVEQRGGHRVGSVRNGKTYPPADREQQRAGHDELEGGDAPHPQAQFGAARACDESEQSDEDANPRRLPQVIGEPGEHRRQRVGFDAASAYRPQGFWQR